MLLIVDPPEITKRPINQSVRVGGVASFFCAARGDPIPSIVWRKNGKKVSGTQSRYSVTQLNGQSILRIEPVRAGRDDAPYECVAENGVGDAVSAEATLTVFEGKRTNYHICSVNLSRLAIVQFESDRKKNNSFINLTLHYPIHIHRII